MNRSDMPDFEEILESIGAREARVAEREARLDTRSEALALAERRIDEKLQDLAAAEEDLRAMIALSEGAAENDLAQLTSVYEKHGCRRGRGPLRPDDAGFRRGISRAHAPGPGSGDPCRARPGECLRNKRHPSRSKRAGAKGMRG